MDSVPADWYEHFFAGGWFKVAEQAQEKTKEEVAFVVDVLGLDEGDRVLDLACGIGRHSLELARRRMKVVGVDLNEPSLEIARRAAADEDLSIEFVGRDMRAVDFDERFDAAINMWTSFGFFETEEEDQLVLARVAAALSPGGAFLMDVMNPLWLVRYFDPVDATEFEDGTLLIQRRAYDLFTGRVENEWTFVQPGGERETKSFSARAYTMPELTRMLDAVGLEVAGSWGDFDGGALGFDSRRLILIGRKR
jgi:ubiquinone/menaquinone biosynthesis C-methylase UbiE